ncbi:MAG: bifunctional [glutamate--ammonia ligase]-adenylyl-L-tyrosine phosphorylase/[glutamate--ammonia-ligase] adenylyltransferase [Betaproteobacteria bacterium]
MTPSHSIDPCPAEASSYAAAWHHSAFARRALPGVISRGQLLDVRAAITPDVLTAHFQRFWADVLRAASPEAMTVALRQFRNSALLAIMARDLAGTADLNESLESITALADMTINAAYASAMAVAIAQHGIPRDHQGQPQDMMIIGMGKLGGRELNASSDVDLIYVFPDDGETDATTTNSRPIDAASFFIKVGRRIAALLGEVTADGIVFRVDLRLRPNGDSGPLAVSLGMLEQYFIVQGREWERYAWIKARVVNQPVAQTPSAFQQAISGLHDIVRPFVFRRYLDFNVMAALRELHGQIREEAQRRQSNRESHMAGEHAPVDVKLGPGGIREIEFIAQLFQLIRGGKEEPLRARSTREIYHYLKRSRRLESQEVKMLLNAYEFWRRLEHRLQYLDDAQTHVMPGKLATIAHLAQSMSYESAEAFLQALEQTQRQVQQSFERLFTAEPAGPTPAESGKPAAETRLERLKAQAQRFASETANPEQTLTRLHQLLESIGRRASYLALFDEYPNAFLRVAHLVSASAWAADYLRQHPIVLDELLDVRAAEDPPDQQAFIDELRTRVAEAVHNGVPDIEQQMDALRETHHAALFRLLVQDLDGRWSVETLSDHLSAMADSVLQVTLETVWPTLTRRHRDTPQFAVIAYGRLGGKELGYASDLDLIFLYDDSHESASEIYVRYAQRINVWLSTATAAGTLFDIDLRLRPNGNAGLLVTSVEGFLDYQHRHAWVWEHQALTRARFCAGDRDIGQRFEAERERLLRLARPTEGLLEEVLAMRQKMHDGHPNPSAQFDIKHDRGGMVDIEFIVQTLVLRHSHAHPTLTGNLGNIALLRIAGELGLIDAGLAAQVGDAYRSYRKRQHAERLSGAASARVDAHEFQAQQAAVIALWEAVFREAPATIRSLQALHQSASGSA